MHTGDFTRSWYSVPVLKPTKALQPMAGGPSHVEWGLLGPQLGSFGATAHHAPVEEDRRSCIVVLHRPHQLPSVPGARCPRILPLELQLPPAPAEHATRGYHHLGHAQGIVGCVSRAAGLHAPAVQLGALAHALSLSLFLPTCTNSWALPADAQASGNVSLSPCTCVYNLSTWMGWGALNYENS